MADNNSNRGSRRRGNNSIGRNAGTRGNGRPGRSARRGRTRSASDFLSDAMESWGKYLALALILLLVIGWAVAISQKENKEKGFGAQKVRTGAVGSLAGSSTGAANAGGAYGSSAQGVQSNTQQSSGQAGQILSVPELTRSELSVEAAETVSFSGSFSKAEQVDIYTFTAEQSGTYRVDVTGVYSGTMFSMTVLDELGSKVNYDGYCRNGSGLTLNELEAGHTYRVKLEQREGFSDYQLTIGMQRAPLDISGYTEISDSVSFTDQCNLYTFVVPVDGLYRFDMTEIYSGTAFEFTLLNRLGETVDRESYCTNRGGLTLDHCKAGETYQLKVAQREELGTYTLKIGYQKETVDISAFSEVKDSIQYRDQRNVYLFTPAQGGEYRFEFADMPNTARVRIRLLNYLGETLEEEGYAGNGDGITVYGLEAGTQYELQLIWSDDLCDYTLKIQP